MTGTTPSHPGPTEVVVEVLGPTRARQGEESLPLSAIQRRLLARLAIAAPNAVVAAELQAAAWDGDPPATARAALNNQVSRLRARLGGDAVATSDFGVALVLRTDAAEATAQVTRAEVAFEAGRSAEAADLADAAVGRWRGTPLGELGDRPVAVAERRRLAEVLRAAENVRLAAALDLGRVAWAVPEAERLVAETPYDEERWCLLVRALDGAGRRGDALGAYERARRTLAEGLGLEPGARLRATEAEVLSGGTGAGRVRAGRLVGRQALLASAIQRATSGGDLVLVGEAGSGKTAILGAIANRLRRAPVRVGRGSGRANAYAPISALAEILDDIGAIRDATADPVVGFAAAVARVAATSPVVLLVDDLDLVGPTTASALAAAATQPHVSLIATARRTEELPQPGTEMAAIPPLDRQDVAVIAAEQAGEALDPGSDTVGWLTDMSGGNPLLLECLLEDAPPGTPIDLSRSRPLSGASALRGLVRRRVGQLDPSARTALDVAAVCAPDLVASVLSELSSPNGLRAVTEAGFLDEQTDRRRARRLSFRHGAVQTIVYEDIPPGRRIEVHHHAAALLHAAGAPAAAVARHALAAAEMDPLGASEHGLAAAAEATSHGAHADAARWCEAAASAAAQLGSAGEHHRVTALVRRGDGLRLTGAPEHEVALFEAADAALAHGDPALVGGAAFAILQLGATTESGSLHGRAIELADRALAIVTDPEQRALIAAAASLTHSMTGSPELCRALFLEAESVPASGEVRGRILPFAYLSLGHPADLDKREVITEELHAIARATADPVAHFEALQLSFSVALQRADGRRARRTVAELDDLVLRVGDVGREWALRYMQSALAHLDDDLDTSERLAEEALAIFTPVSPSRAFATYGAQLLIIRVAQGRLAELSDTIQGLVDEQPGVPAWHAAHALAQVDLDPDVARRHAALALEKAAPDFTWLASHVIGGRAAALVGDAALIERYRSALAPWVRLVCWQGTCAYGPVATTAARLAAAAGDGPEARRLTSLARRLARSLHAPVFERDLSPTPGDPRRPGGPNLRP